MVPHFVNFLWALLTLNAAVASIPSDWVQYTPGTCNVVISSTHGGSLKPSEIADRTDGCLQADGKTCTWEKGCAPADSTKCRAGTVKDAFTQEISAMVVGNLTALHNCLPHYVRSNLHRVKLDLNREINEAAQGDASAQEAWRVYHERFMAAAVQAAREPTGLALVVDIHGQDHEEQRIELGYLISKTELNAGPKDLTRSSIRGLASRTGLTPTQLLTGPHSFGAILSARDPDYKVVPSEANPSPGTGSYFSGGYVTEQYGSVVSGETDAVQVEIPSGIRWDRATREKFAADLASSIQKFREVNGYIGNNRNNGDNGDNGNNGDNGDNGNNGYNGYNGHNGHNGLNG